jgi:hypothetical protein
MTKEAVFYLIKMYEIILGRGPRHQKYCERVCDTKKFEKHCSKGHSKQQWSL